MRPPMGQTDLILASASPRRRELLGQIGIAFRVEPAHVDETVRPGEPPRDYVLRVAREKAEKVAERAEGLVLAADTSVVIGTEILGKPADAKDALRMLRALSGRAHRVITAVALARGGSGATESIVVETEVEMRQASDEELRWYVATGEPMDKAGGYAIQGAGGMLVKAIRGSYSCVVGLPLAETVALLEAAGLSLPWRRT